MIASQSAGAAAAGAARLAYSAMNRRPPGGPKAWSRTNHRGEPVTLLEGPAVAVGAIAGVLARRLTGSASWRASAAIAVGGAGAAAFGAYDDLAGSGDRRGFRGHLGALRHGEVTTGAVKLGGIGVTGIVSAVLAGGSPADVVINAGLVAGGANLLNLFDLRPGRAIKVAVASGALIGAAGQDSVAAPLAAALALLPEDLGERAMLGDAGANALGAMLGASAAGLSRPTRIALLAGIAGLTAASEKVSFTKVIERTPALRWLDMLGRARGGVRRADRVPPGAGGSGGSPPRTSRVTAPVAERGSARQRGGGIGRAAVLIGAITMLARVIGFGRQVVFAHTVQASCLGTAYTTANMVPNIIYDIVMGGALTAVVVPVLAGPARAAGGGDGAADREQVRQTSAALLSWTVLLLVPVSVVVAVIARPLVSLLLGGTPGCPRASHGRPRRADAGGVRAADPALRAGRGAVRHPAVTPQVRRARAGAGAVQPGRHRRLLLVRRDRERLPGHGPAGARPWPGWCWPPGPRPGWRRWSRPRSSRPPGCTYGCGPACGSRPGSARGSARWPPPASRR